MYSFYPTKNNACPNAKHCPHAGGASIAMLVLLANKNEGFRRQLHGTIDAERKQNDKLFEENQQLR